MRYKKPIFRQLLLLLALVFIPAAVQAETLNGRTVQVISGNRLVLIAGDDTRYRLRLAGIETPPANEYWGASAKRFLGMLVSGRSLRLKRLHEDPDGFFIAKVFYGDSDISLRLIEAGLAMHKPDDKSSIDSALYSAAEQEARQRKQGMWSRGPDYPRTQGKTLRGGPVIRLQK